MEDQLTVERMIAARDRIGPYLKPSPLIENSIISGLIGRTISLKLELLQPSGSFKIRGAMSKILAMSDDEKAKGCVAVSGGNHGLAVARATQFLGVSAQIFLPKTAAQRSIDRIRNEGADLVLCDDIADAFAQAAMAAKAGKTFVHPFDDLDVIAGQATIGLEIVESPKPPTDLIISIGGGGLFSGVSSTIKALRPDTRIWAVETEGAEAMTQAVRAGHPVDVKITSIATTLGAPCVSDATLAITKAHMEELLVVPDSDAVRDMVVLLEEAKLMCEPATACTLSAARLLADRLPEDARVGLIICGGNVTLEELNAWRTRFGV